MQAKRSSFHSQNWWPWLSSELLILHYEDSRLTQIQQSFHSPLGDLHHVCMGGCRQKHGWQITLGFGVLGFLPAVIFWEPGWRCWTNPNDQKQDIFASSVVLHTVSTAKSYGFAALHMLCSNVTTDASLHPVIREFWPAVLWGLEGGKTWREDNVLEGLLA